MLAVITFLCVNSHHGNLKSLKAIRDIINSPTPQYILKQINTVKNDADYISKELETLGLGEVSEFLNNFEKCFNEIKNNFKKTERIIIFKLNEDDKWQLYYNILFLFSCLIDADKKDAGMTIQNQPKSPYNLTPEIITSYINNNFNKIPTSDIDKIRRDVFSEIQNNLKNILKKENIRKNNIFTITAPTGSGKTLSGVYTALEIKNILSDGQHKIIYCLPYINIIEQTHSTLTKILKNYYNTEIDNSILLKYHHLAFPSSKNDEEEKHLDELLLLVDSWESEIIVTTFEQLFRTLIGGENSQLKKFHNLAGSIIILDEIQSIPLEYWRLVRDLLLKFSEKLNSTIIMMTATMPSIFKGEELLTNYKIYFKKLERTCLIPQVKNPINYEELVELFFQIWNSKESALIVLNTIESSKKVYKKIAEKLGNKMIPLTSKNAESMINHEKIVLAYLSTSVLPKERLERIKKLKNLLEKRQPVILVSTQIVEAGVDLDFDVVIRDIGPLDSIVQVAGRCNRHWKNKLGKVYVLRVIDENGVEDAKKIYERILPNRSLEFLKNKNNITEKMLGELINSYYDDIFDRIGVEEREESRDILEKIMELDFESIKHFTLIKEEPKIPVYIEIDEESTSLLKKFYETLNKLINANKANLKEIFNYKAHLRKLTAKMEEYTVEVYTKNESLKNLKPLANWLKTRLLPKEEVEYYYDVETGYKSDKERAEDSFII